MNLSKTEKYQFHIKIILQCLKQRIKSINILFFSKYCRVLFSELCYQNILNFKYFDFV